MSPANWSYWNSHSNWTNTNLVSLSLVICAQFFICSLSIHPFEWNEEVRAMKRMRAHDTAFHLANGIFVRCDELSQQEWNRYFGNRIISMTLAYIWIYVNHFSRSWTSNQKKKQRKQNEEREREKTQDKNKITPK